MPLLIAGELSRGLAFCMPNEISSIQIVLCNLGKVSGMKDQRGQGTFIVLGMPWKTGSS